MLRWIHPLSLDKNTDWKLQTNHISHQIETNKLKVCRLYNYEGWFWLGPPSSFTSSHESFLVIFIISFITNHQHIVSMKSATPYNWKFIDGGTKRFNLQLLGSDKSPTKSETQSFLQSKKLKVLIEAQWITFFVFD